MIFYFSFGIFSIFTLFTFWFALSSFREKAFRACTLGLILAASMAIGLSLYAWAAHKGLLSGAVILVLQYVVTVGAVIFTLTGFIPSGRNPSAFFGTKSMIKEATKKFNQKDTAFNIAHVGGYGPEVAKLRWSLQSQDPFGGLYWTLCMALRNHVDGPVNPEKNADFSQENMTKEIKDMARYLGADLVGVTTVKDDFVYSDGFSYEDSKLEKGPAVTSPIDLRHKYIIVLAKEMDYAKVQTTLTDKNEENEGEVGSGVSYQAPRLLRQSASLA